MEITVVLVKKESYVQTFVIILDLLWQSDMIIDSIVSLSKCVEKACSWTSVFQPNEISEICLDF